MEKGGEVHIWKKKLDRFFKKNPDRFASRVKGQDQVLLAFKAKCMVLV